MSKDPDFDVLPIASCNVLNAEKSELQSARLKGSALPYAPGNLLDFPRKPLSSAPGVLSKQSCPPADTELLRTGTSGTLNHFGTRELQRHLLTALSVEEGGGYWELEEHVSSVKHLHSTFIKNTAVIPPDCRSCGPKKQGSVVDLMIAMSRARGEAFFVFIRGRRDAGRGDRYSAHLLKGVGHASGH
ncbi:hypothetical protein Bbelb_174510 [Branchiostoma belcheri]|nr:hypothetical protein Bbelb_174510 [Branchiostoma belcheri]